MPIGGDSDCAASYDAIAEEYYDDGLHKTSRNFDDTTRAALQGLGIKDRIARDGLVLDAGAGRGRVQEFLDVHTGRVVQLDDSAKMLAVEPREASLLRIKHRAESLPFLADQFSCITAFLCDAFVGLNFFSEAFRALRPGGHLVGTLPAEEWGIALRQEIKCDLSLTRFVTRTQKTVFIPSTLVGKDHLFSMLRRVGFAARGIRIEAHRLPRDVKTVSRDIELPAAKLGVSAFDLPILYSFSVQK